MDQAYAGLARYLGVAAQEVHLGTSPSQNTWVRAQAFADLLQPGDEIIATNKDHEANSGVWRRLAARGLVIREWAVEPDTGELDPARLEVLLSGRTRVVPFTHCAHVRAAGAVSVVDGVSFAAHGLLDVADSGADAYLFSLHKTLCPHLGAMVSASRSHCAWAASRTTSMPSIATNGLCPAGLTMRKLRPAAAC